jgi:AAA ATPase domain
MQNDLFANPFMPGAGHMPPYLAGRTQEQEEFKRLLSQTVITQNLILSGLRGVGKTVLLGHLKPIAQQAGWLWTGDEFSEQTALNEDRIVIRIVTDLTLLLGSIFLKTQTELPIGFVSKKTTRHRPLEYADLQKIYDDTPGLVADKLKSVLRYVGKMISPTAVKGIVFAYDEAQNLSDHAQKDQYPLSLLLDVFQSVQKHPGGFPFMLVLTGLPTLFTRLTKARTYSERMFHTLMLDRLSDQESRDAVTVPIQQKNCPVKFTPESVETIVKHSGGYPFFIQYICREAFDLYMAKLISKEPTVIPMVQVLQKLDQNFFSKRWDLVSDPQRIFLKVVAQLPNCEAEFTAQEIIRASKDTLDKKYSSSSVAQYLNRLEDKGLIYRNRFGRYQFAVPMLSGFIRRQTEKEANLPSRFRSSSGT